MATFKLPRLKANLAIVDARGKPLDYFLRLFNIDLAQRIERNEAEQNEILDRLLAAEAAAAAAQATADEALAQAEGGSGARYATFEAVSPTISDQVTVDSVTAETRLSLDGSLSFGTLNADATWNGTATLTEISGGVPLVVCDIPFAVTSTGVETTPGEWGSNGGAFVGAGIGTYTGTVIYQLSYSRSSGSSFVQGPNLNGVLTITPKAT